MVNLTQSRNHQVSAGRPPISTNADTAYPQATARKYEQYARAHAFDPIHLSSFSLAHLHLTKAHPFLLFAEKRRLMFGARFTVKEVGNRENLARATREDRYSIFAHAVNARAQVHVLNGRTNRSRWQLSGRLSAWKDTTPTVVTFKLPVLRASRLLSRSAQRSLTFIPFVPTRWLTTC